jgi:hypothetical protein
LPRRLVLSGGFTVDDARHRHLDQQARRLGSADLRACLQALLDDGWSIPQLATHLNTTQAAIRRAIADHQVRQLPRGERLTRQRQRAAEQRVATRAAELGFESVRAYLVDRLVMQAWSLAQLVEDLGAAPATVRRLLDQHQVRRGGPTQRQRAVPGEGSDPRRRHEPHGSSGKHDWPNLVSGGSMGTCGIGLWGGAGRCGGWAPSSGWATAGWTSSWPGSGCEPEHCVSEGGPRQRELSKPVG